MKYYVGDGKKFYQITKAIEVSNIDPILKKDILEEYEKISLSAQELARTLEMLDGEYDKIKSIVKLIEK